MDLPNNRVGVSDLLDYRECPARFAFKMQRWTEAGEPPEAMGPSNAYGTIIHEIIDMIETKGLSDSDAIQRAFDSHGKWLDPEQLEQVHTDIKIYHERDYLGVRLVGSELELSTPLTTGPNGEVIYFRGKIDRLYQRLDNPAVFIAIDYKSSAHRKSEAEVHQDIQQWAYNFLIHDVYPECETLLQQYDQLNFGVIPTRKSAQQRQTIKEWLTRQALSVLQDTDLAPKYNEWCPWCPLVTGCPVVKRLSTYALSELSTIAPETKVGRKLTVDLDPELFDVYVEELPRVARARQVLERFEETVKKALRDMPAARRAMYGYQIGKPKRMTVFPPEVMAFIHAEMGESFYEAISLTKTGIERALAGDPDKAARILQMGNLVDGASSIVKLR